MSCAKANIRSRIIYRIYNISNNLLVLGDINTFIFVFYGPDKIIISDRNFFWLVSIISNTKFSKSIFQVLLLVNKQFVGLFIVSNPYAQDLRNLL
jgi:hypothetical protein